MNIHKSKIAILTTVVNFELYEKTSVLFPRGIKRYVIDGRNRMHGIDSIKFMISKLKDTEIEWLIMADEDVVFYEPDTVFNIIERMIEKNYTVAGVRDGGVIAHRNHNPHVINTFFSILDMKTVFEIWNKKSMLKNQYTIPNEFNDLINLNFDFNDQSLFEPYYCFYLWLRRNNKKILFLDAKMKPDAIANEVIFDNKAILCHTWYARHYGKHSLQTERINSFISKQNNNYKNEEPIIYKDKFYLAKKPKLLMHYILNKMKN